jgi:hypothetical protein
MTPMTPVARFELVLILMAAVIVLELLARRLRMPGIAHLTGATGVSRPENVDRADTIGVFLETALDADKPFLCLAVLCRDMLASWTGFFSPAAKRAFCSASPLL